MNRQEATNLMDQRILSEIRNASNRDQGYRLLLQTYQDRLYQVIRRMLGNHEDTDDVLQNTFIKVFKHIDRFEGKSQLYTWLHRIAVNESLTFIKQSKRKTSIALDEVPELANQYADSNIDEDKVIVLLQSSIAQLPEKQRLVFSLRYFDEMTYDEISNLLGTSVGGLKASYHHAVKKIESLIKTESTKIY